MSHGRAVWCAPTGADGTGRNGRGFMVLDTDPMAANAGVDAGMQVGALTMRAPDVAVGAFQEKGGWIQGALPLAVEYAGQGRDDDDREGLESGIEKGIERGIERGVVEGLGPLERVFARRLGRPLTGEERATLLARRGVEARLHSPPLPCASAHSSRSSSSH